MYGNSNQQMGYGQGFPAAYGVTAPQFAYPQQEYPSVGMYEISGQLPQEYYGQPGGVFTPTAYAAPAGYSPYGQYPQVGLWELPADLVHPDRRVLLLRVGELRGSHAIRGGKALPVAHLLIRIAVHFLFVLSSS
jgi:hypothetical protein